MKNSYLNFALTFSLMTAMQSIERASVLAAKNQGCKQIPRFDALIFLCRSQTRPKQNHSVGTNNASSKDFKCRNNS